MRLGYLHLPRFPVQRRVLEQPSLLGRPLVLHADERGTQRVCFASGAALKAGVRPGQTVASASALEPEVVRLVFDAAAAARALASLGEALLGLAPGFQVDAPEGLWLDASAAPLSGGEAAWAARVESACPGLGLFGRCVVASERFTAQALARFHREGGGRPASPTVVPPRGGGLLAALPLDALESGWLGPDAAAPFRALGLTTLGEVAALSSGALVARFGALGLQAARLSRGEDDSRFTADAPAEVLEESVVLDWPAEHLEPLLFALKTAVDRLTARLQGRRLAAVRLTVALGLDGGPRGGDGIELPLVLARPSAQARLLVELVRHRLTDLTVEQPISSLALTVEEACEDRGRQLLLGDAPAGEAELEVVLSRLQSALGEDALFSAAPAAKHRPEEGWAQVPFRPASLPLPAERGEGRGEGPAKQGERPEEITPHPALRALPLPAERGEGRGEGPHVPPDIHPLPDPHALAYAWVSGAVARARAAKKAPPPLPPLLPRSTLLSRPVRLFREPTLLRGEVSERGELRTVLLLGRRRRVESLEGPERLAGDWWAEAPFARDYFRVQLEGVGALWIYRDGRDGQFYAHGVFD